MSLIKDLNYYRWELRKNKSGMVWHIIILCLVIIGPIYLSKNNYNVFHLGIEVYSSIVGLMTFIIVINAHRASKQSALLILGIGYGFVGFFNLLHALARGYTGAAALSIYIINVSNQLWICTEYILVISLFISFMLIYKDIKFTRFSELLWIYSVISGMLLLSIFKWRIFPSCYIEGVGHTSLRYIRDYLITVTLPIIVIILFKSRRKIDVRTFLFMELSMIFLFLHSIAINISMYGYIIGHAFKLISFYFVYKAIVEVALRKPYEFLASNLEEKIFELEDTSEKLNVESRLRNDMEQVLRENEECYSLIIQNSQDGICIHSKGKIIFANENAAKIFGISDLRQVIGKSIIDFVSEDNKEKILKLSRDSYIKSVTKPCIETTITTRDGKDIYVKVRNAYFIYKGSPTMLSIITNLTSDEQVEKLKLNVKEKQQALDESIEFNKSLTEFFANISHELRTPLNVLLGAVQVLDLYNEQKEQNYERINRYLKTMKQNCYRLQRLVNNLIDISKIDAGYLELRLTNKNIVSIVEEITLSVAGYVESKGINLIFDTNVEEKEIACDPDIIERIVLNFLSNAIKFTSPGDEIKVNFVDKGSTIEISVQDTGIGIPKDKLETIFKRFGQVDKTLRRNREGSGIGLSLVKSLVEMQNGTVSVKSKVGEGSEFKIILPVKLVNKEITFKEIDYENDDTKVERINIEFSDIYS